jgi:hypothetical protein
MDVPEPLPSAFSEGMRPLGGLAGAGELGQGVGRR